MIRWSEVTAVFGGSFDPPHLGHLRAIQGLFKNPGVKRVLVLPNGRSRVKAAYAANLHRMEMLRLCFGESAQNTGRYPIEIHSYEIERAEQHPNHPTLSYDTILALRQTYMPLAFVIGIDQLVQLPTWYRFPEILRQCHWLVLTRKLAEGSDSTLKALSEWVGSGILKPSGQNNWHIIGFPYELRLVPTEAPQLSSTEIREAIARNGLPPADSLTPQVWNYLKQNRLYGSHE